MVERRDDSAILGMLTSVVESITAMRKELSEHIAEEPHAIEEACKRAVDGMIEQAFPEGDLPGHRSAHQEMIDSYRSRKEFYQKMLFELSKWGLLGFTLWLLKAAFDSALAYVHHAPK